MSLAPPSGVYMDDVALPATTATATLHWYYQSVPEVSKNDHWIETYWNSQERNSRRVVLQGLQRFPWHSLVEVGCHAGPMLAKIHEAYPQATLRGLDVNAAAIDAGRAYLPGVTFEVADLMRWLPEQPTQGVDVLLSHFTLAYVDRDDLDAVMAQCFRVARYLVLAEPMVCDAFPNAMLYPEFPMWRHDYVGACLRRGVSQLSASPVAPDATEHADDHHRVNFVVIVDTHAT